MEGNKNFPFRMTAAMALLVGVLFGFIASGASYSGRDGILVQEKQVPECDPLVEYYDLSLREKDEHPYYDSSNLGGALAWGESYLMMSLMEMYRSTGNTKYLLELLFHIRKTIDQRDDRNNRADFRGVVGPVWLATAYSTDQKSPYTWIVHTGMLTYPMADFASTIINDPSLWFLVDSSGRKFIEIARDLIGEVEQSVRYHDDQWDSVKGFYRERETSIVFYSGKPSPYNMQAALGRTLLALYSATKDKTYLDKASAIASYFKHSLIYHQTTNCYTWAYSDSTETVEDVSHAMHELNFAYLCYQYGIVFDATDMKRFANTLVNAVYSSPLNFASSVNGKGKTASLIPMLGNWLFLTDYSSQVYHIIEDLFIDDMVNRKAMPYGTSLLTISYLSRYSGFLKPVAIRRSTDKSAQWSSVVTGDFSNDGTIEIAALRKNDGAICVYRLENGTLYQAGFWYPDEQKSDSVSCLLAGDFNGDGKTELAAVRTDNGKIYLFDTSSSLIFPDRQLGSFPTESTWSFPVAGDFDGTGTSEIAAVRNTDGALVMFKPIDGFLRQISSPGYFGISPSWKGLTVGVFDGGKKCELAALRGTDGSLCVFRFENGAIVCKATESLLAKGDAWLSVCSVDADNDGKDEILTLSAVSAVGGIVTEYKLDAGKFIGLAADSFPKNGRYELMVASRLKPAPGAHLILFRNYDGSVFLYGLGNNAWRK